MNATQTAPKGYTVSEAAAELNIAVSTLTRRLRAIGEETPRGRIFTLRQLLAALTSKDGDKSALLRARRLKAEEEAKLLAFERREKERDLVPLAEIQALIRDSFLPVRQRLMALPSEMSARCNPSDPQLAREALDRWLTDSLPIIRAGLAEQAKAKKEKGKG